MLLQSELQRFLAKALEKAATCRDVRYSPLEAVDEDVEGKV